MWEFQATAVSKHYLRFIIMSRKNPPPHMKFLATAVVVVRNSINVGSYSFFRLLFFFTCNSLKHIRQAAPRRPVAAK